VSKALVLKSTGSLYTVRTAEGDILDCKIKGSFRLKGIKNTNPLAVGDWVEIELQPNSTTAFITTIHQRKNYIIRRSSNLSKQAHIIAANIDQALLMVTLVYPETYVQFIDRFLASSEAYNIPAKLIFNKTDLYTPETLQKMDYLQEVYTAIGYPCFSISVKENQGIEAVRKLLKDKVSVISGNSGVGKSSLINCLDNSLNLRTSEISDYHEKGKHTTTFTELFELNSGGYIIDTPGIKGFGLVDMNRNEIFHFFPEMFKISAQCQFYNCTHTHEPGCAVKASVENGSIAGFRYDSYLGLFFEDESKYR
jgi:ribosome biogenesis GTPase / thiamine phosphate phosphatase